ncbi:3-ketodihydrosphingosine reductase precursor [Panicum miliaceum]|uniref:3-ketodihydrosphingosine reductase n=1 Tax=Panicum miliaceum TaxID=4540 RepID=A0A3L6RQE4_PANMI|nr:3-ketodihydrosphingosine reductase precursor [Panicum miliaceum]
MAAALLLLLVPPVGLLAALAFLARPRAARVPLKGRHVFITGRSSGIGLAMATAAAREGARVSILARNLARLEEARAAIQRESGRGDVGVHAADVRDADAVARALREAGPVDVLVCNHGVFVPQELERQDMEEIKWMVDTNLMGTFHLIKAALPAMKARTRETRLPGPIAIMSSQAEHKRRPELTNIIAGSSGGMKANDVAKKALDGVKSGKFIVPCNFEGAILAVATAGLSPQSSPVMAFLEVIGAGLMRFAALCFQWNWFSTIESYYANNKKPE